MMSSMMFVRLTLICCWCMCGCLASQKVRVILHTKPPKQEDFDCLPTTERNYSSIPPGTYVDLVAYNMEACDCWFHTSGTIKSKMLDQRKYICFREFHLHNDHVDYHDCNVTPRKQKMDHHLNQLGGNKLLARITQEDVVFLDNSTDEGIVDSSLRFAFSQGGDYSLASLRVQASEKMDIMCGISTEPETTSTTTTSTTTTTTTTPASTTTTTTTTTTPIPTLPSTTPTTGVETTEPDPESPKSTAFGGGFVMDQAKSTPTMENFRNTTKNMINGGLDSELAISGVNQQNDAENQQELTILGISLPVLIGAAAGGVGLLLIMLILVVCLSRKKQKKKDEPQHEVVYRLVSTDNNCGEGQVSIPVSPNTKLPSSRPPSDPDSHPGNPTHGSYEFRAVEPELGSEDYEYSQIRVIPGSGDALALHKGAPPADPLDDPDGYYTHDSTMPDISRFHGYHAISPILGGKERRGQNGGGDTRENTLSGDYDNVMLTETPPCQTQRYPADNYATIHQFINPQNTSTPNAPPKPTHSTGVNGMNSGFGQGIQPKSSFKGSGYAPVLRSNGHMGLEEEHKDLEAMYAKPNKQRNGKASKNGRNGVSRQDGRGIYH